VKVSLLYFDGCPNWRVARARLVEALRRGGLTGEEVERVLVTTPEQAQAMRFRGSPTVLIDGLDPFAPVDDRPFGLTCRVYRTDAGLAGSPTVEQLVDVLASSLGD
jgi:hypothetical protein